MGKPYTADSYFPRTVLTTIRIPLTSFRIGGVPVPMIDVHAVILDVQGSGLIAVDDIQFTK